MARLFPSAGFRRLLGCRDATFFTSLRGARMRMARERGRARSRMTLALERRLGRARSLRRWLRAAAAFGGILPGLLAGGSGCRLRIGRSEFHAGATRLGQPDCDGLFGVARAMLAFPHMMDFLADKFARLS